MSAERYRPIQMLMRLSVTHTLYVLTLFCKIQVLQVWAVVSGRMEEHIRMLPGQLVSLRDIGGGI